ncbi:MAG: hypothetical protein ABL862_09115, partial [Candidatus Nitrotoga sp.]
MLLLILAVTIGHPHGCGEHAAESMMGSADSFMAVVLLCAYNFCIYGGQHGSNFGRIGKPGFTTVAQR